MNPIKSSNHMKFLSMHETMSKNKLFICYSKEVIIPYIHFIGHFYLINFSDKSNFNDLLLKSA